jgi:DNA polymerase III subunit delta
MTQISYNLLEKYLQEIKEDKFAPVYLLFGDDLLYKTASKTLLARIIPEKERSLNHEILDGTDAGMKEAVQRVNTFSLLPGIKVVSVVDSRVFYSREDSVKLLQKVKEAFESNRMEQATKRFMTLLSLLNLSFEDLEGTNRKRALKLKEDEEWIDTVIDHCVEKGLTFSKSADSSKILQGAIEAGFPGNNHLVITTDLVDRRKSLFKTIDTHGVVVDCSVPKGQRRADKMAQEVVLSEQVKEILSESGKKLDRNAYRVMADMTGFDLRTFSSNLKKLVSYVGDRDRILVEDVQSVLKRTRKDPIFEFTNAVTDRSMEKALFYLHSLLSDDLHPLQILAAIVNQVRKLLVIKGFTGSSRGSVWTQGCTYGDFQTRVMPVIKAYDAEFISHLSNWEIDLEGDRDTGAEPSGRSSKRKKQTSKTDLLIAKNPKNTYPIYQMLKKSDNFPEDKLLAILGRLHDADRQLKTTSHDEKRVLERVLFFICIEPKQRAHSPPLATG